MIKFFIILLTPQWRILVKPIAHILPSVDFLWNCGGVTNNLFLRNIAKYVSFINNLSLKNGFLCNKLQYTYSTYKFNTIHMAQAVRAFGWGLKPSPPHLIIYNIVMLQTHPNF